jgi:murein DD-endopeptidase MepM/ murein hydrolase activator NlpD
VASPVIVNYITRAAAQTGADPVVMLATSLAENGAREGLTPGDNGSSFAYFQMHRGGALGNHTPQWAAGPGAALNRAKEFARLKVHGGAGAAAIQRPADPAGYAAKVDSYLEQARAILGRQSPVLAAAATKTPAALASAPTTDAPNAAQRNALLQGLLADAPATDLLSLVQQAKGQSAPAKTPRAVSSSSGGAPNPTPAIATGKVTTLAPKIIGTPHAGTHRLGNWESDDAIDIAMPVGTPLYAAFDGTIGSQIGALDSKNPRMAGLRLHLAGAGNELYYAHLSRLAVAAGQKVKRGQLIGYSGSANGTAHLHLGSKDGNPSVYA